MKFSRLPQAYRSKAEYEWSYRLEIMKQNGEIRNWYYEPINIRLGEATYYRPDFLIIHNDGEAVFQEIKGGFIRDKSLVKYKAAADKYPEMKFEMWQKQKGYGWEKIK